MYMMTSSSLLGYCCRLMMMSFICSYRNKKIYIY